MDGPISTSVGVSVKVVKGNFFTRLLSLGLSSVYRQIIYLKG